MERFDSKERAARGPRGGFTLIELAIATSILMIGIVSVLQASSQMHSLRRFNRERTVAHNALRSVAERMHASAHGFSIDPGTWAAEMLATYGPGGTFGQDFPVEGLTEQAGQPAVGRITISSDETAIASGFGSALGMPRDLNGDGDAGDTDVSGNARLLPVMLTLRWNGSSGAQVMRHGFYVMGY